MKLNFCNFLSDDIFRCTDFLEKKNIIEEYEEYVTEEYEEIPRLTKVTWGIWKPENAEQKYLDSSTHHSSFQDISKII